MQEVELRSCEPPVCWWRMLVACALLNKTHHRQARPALDRLIARWPTPQKFCVDAKADEVAEIIKECGLQNRRSWTLLKLADACVFDGWDKKVLGTFPSVGKYARDSWLIFVLGQTDVAPTDKELLKYMEWRNG